MLDRRPGPTGSSERGRRPVRSPYQQGRRPETDYFAFLAGKRVVLVGPAAYLVGQRKGPEFDAYDIIIRMNLSCPVPSALKLDLGGRTDVLYHVILSRLQMSQRPDLFRWHTRAEVAGWKAAGVKWLVSKRNLAADRVKEFAGVVDGILPWVTIPGWLLRRFEDDNNVNPNMGTVVVWHVLRSKARSLHVTGCDFHATGYYPGYGGFTAEQAALGKNSARCWGQIPQPARPMHDIEAQLRYLKRLMTADRRFTVDETLGRRLAET